MKSVALSFKTSRLFRRIPLFLPGLIIIAAVCCGGSNSYGTSWAADDTGQQSKTASVNKEIPKPANIVFKDTNVITMKDEKTLKKNSPVGAGE